MNVGEPTVVISGKYARSNYVVCFGSDRMVPDANGVHIPGDSSRSGVDLETDGAFRLDKSRRMRDFTDGTSTSALLSEVMAGPDEVFDDTDWDTRGMWGVHHMGAFAYTHRNTPNSSVGDSLWRTSGYKRCIELRDMPCDSSSTTLLDTHHAAARSRHPDGVQVAFADGHVSFISDTIDLDTWQALGAINDGLVISGEY